MNSVGMDCGCAGHLNVAAQLVEWAASVSKIDPTVHAVRANVFAAMRERETSLMAKGVYKAAQLQSEAVLRSKRWQQHLRESRVIKYASKGGTCASEGTVANNVPSCFALLAGSHVQRSRAA